MKTRILIVSLFVAGLLFTLAAPVYAATNTIYVRFINASNADAPLFIDGGSKGSVAAGSVTPYMQIQPGRQLIKMGALSKGFNFTQGRAYTLYSPSGSQLLLAHDDWSPVTGAAALPKDKTIFWVYNIGTLPFYEIRSTDKEKPFAPIVYNGVKSTIIEQSFRDPGTQKLAVFMSDRKIADLPMPPRKAGEIYTVVLAGTPEQPVFLVTPTDYPLR